MCEKMVRGICPGAWTVRSPGHDANHFLTHRVPQLDVEELEEPHVEPLPGPHVEEPLQQPRVSATAWASAEPLEEPLQQPLEEPLQQPLQEAAGRTGPWLPATSFSTAQEAAGRTATSAVSPVSRGLAETATACASELVTPAAARAPWASGDREVYVGWSCCSWRRLPCIADATALATLPYATALAALPWALAPPR